MGNCNGTENLWPSPEQQEEQQLSLNHAVEEKLASIVISPKDTNTINAATTTTTNGHSSNKANPQDHDSSGGKTSSSTVSPPSSPSTSPLLRLKNIHANSIEADTNFVRPIFAKADSEKFAIQRVLETNFVFSTIVYLEKNLEGDLIDAFEKVIFPKNHVIIQQGSVGDFFYVIERGIVEFTIDGSIVGSAGPGSSFGDLALIYNCPRAATCTSKSSTCTLWRLDQVTYRNLVANNAMVNETTKRKLLKNIPFLSSVDSQDLNKMAFAATTVRFSRKKVIVQKGEIGQDFFVVQEGKVTIQDIEVGGKTFEDQTLGPGEYFGERAIVRDQPRVANVYASDDVVLLSISQEVFMKVLGPLKNLVIKANDLRRLKGIPAFANSDITDSEYRSLISLMKDKTLKSGVTIVQEKSTISGAIYMIRTGGVTISSSQDKKSKTVSEGGYFGEHTMHQPSYESKVSAITHTKTDMGSISYQDIKSVIRDMSRLQVGGSKKNSFIDRSIQMNDLTKHRLLGVGTFGKVWLVTHEKNKKISPYALKIQDKRTLLDAHMVDGVKREAQVMASLDHPFIIKMMNLYQTKKNIIMLLQLVPGGELYSYMKMFKKNRLPEKHARFYAGCILEGLSYMHHRDVIYRDLKPENVLINSDGYIVIVDMGFAKVVKDITYTNCGTPWYIAPEVIVGKGHDKGCDYWSWAILLHEMLSGANPFRAHGTSQMALFKAIVQGKSKILNSCGTNGKDLIKKILIESRLRLGCLAGGDMDIKNHKFFEDVDFNDLVDKKLTPPWKPGFDNWDSTTGFDNWDHTHYDEKRTMPLSRKEQEQFKDFDNILKSDSIFGRFSGFL